MASPSIMAALVGVGSGPLAGQRFELPNGYLRLGKAPGCFLHLDSPGVESEHAALTVNGARVTVEDLGSAAGTFVNGLPIQGPHELNRGYVLRISDVEMRYDAAETAPPPVGGFDIDRETGEQIYNVVGNVYQQRRDGLLRDIAAAKTRGRRMIAIGAVIFLIGFAVYAAGILGFISQIARGAGARRLPSTPFGPLILGVPSGLIGFVLALTVFVLIIVGIVRHVTATARRRQIERDMPLQVRGDHGADRRRE